jgi:predicted nucleic acid-binding protein
LSELHFVLVSRGGQSPAQAAEIVSTWLKSAFICEVGAETINQALRFAADHRLQIYDAVILASVAGHADILLSEDMQDGFSWNGVTVVNPFIARNLARLRA